MSDAAPEPGRGPGPGGPPRADPPDAHPSDSGSPVPAPLDPGASVHAAHPSRSRLVRALWIALGLLCVAIGGVGVVLPGLPTTPFLVLAAACFARSSQRLYDWLLARPTLGPLIANFREGRGIPRRARTLALTMMWAFVALAVGLFLPDGWLAARVVVLALAAIGTLYLAAQPTY